jgi:hypothetical protein
VEVAGEVSVRWQLHPTSIGVFNTCGEKYRRRYLDRDRPRGRGEALIVGTALDVAVAADLLEKIRTGNLLPEADVLDIARDSVNDAFMHDVDLPPTDRLMARRKIQERVRSLVEYAHRKFCPPIFPKAIQRPFSIRLDSFLRRRGLRGMKVDMVGTLDIEAYIYDFSSATEPAGEVIHDLKSSKRSPPANAADSMHWLQMAFYALGKEHEDQKLPAWVQIDTLVTLKRGVEHKTSRGMRDNFDFAALFNRVELMARSLRSGIFPAASRSHWACSKEWCEYFESCPYVKNAKVIDLAVPSQRLYRIGPATNPEPTVNPPLAFVQGAEREIVRKDVSEPCPTKKPPKGLSPTDSA